MVRLYTWEPTTLETIVHAGIAPDVGHSALEIATPDGPPRVYASYWPERDSLIGRLTQFWKPRQSRHPSTYQQECDPHAGYMQRPADYTAELSGMDEDAIYHLWQEVATSEYDVLRWNCSSVSKFLLLNAVVDPYRAAMLEAMNCDVELMAQLAGSTALQDMLSKLVASQLLECKPDDVKCAVETYLAAAARLSGASLDQIPEKRDA